MQKENIKTTINTYYPKLDLGSSTHTVAVNRQPAWKIPYQVRDDVFINNGAFTLIELLVVVLIIGILAAVALPQYQKAVTRTEAMQGLSLIKLLAQDAERYYLEHNSFPNTFEELDIKLPKEMTGTVRIYDWSTSQPHSNKTWSIVFEKDAGTFAIHLGKIKGPYQGTGFSYYLKNPATIPNHRILCFEVIGYSSYLFKKHPGDFCVNFLNGTQVWNSGLRLYIFN